MLAEHCSHVSWLEIQGNPKSGFSVRCEDRYKRISRDLLAPSKQRPSLALFLGNRKRDTALKHLFPNNNLKRHQPSLSAVNLRIDNGSIATEHPVLFADCDPTRCTSALSDNQLASCHERASFSLPWALSHPDDVLDSLLARLVFPFTDVICIFADDVGGLENVGNALVKWAKYGQPLAFPGFVRPRAIIITGGDSDASVTHSVLEWDDFRFQVLQTDKVDLTESFAAIKVIQLAGHHFSPLVRYRGLKDVISKALDESRDIKAFYSASFSATHQAALFQNALTHVARTINDPFDIIHSTRKGIEIQPDYSGHLEHFFSLTAKLKLPYDTIASHVASTILVDAYPPRMHCKSSPNCINQLTASQCLIHKCSIISFTNRIVIKRPRKYSLQHLSLNPCANQLRTNL
jgi:hypothetical protein